jgi:crossover junction endodeoxyribonuclease RuvC
MGTKKPEYQRSFHIGIDLGKNGGIVIQQADSITLIKMPKIGKELDLHQLHKILEPYEGGNGMVLFEKIVPYGVKTAMFSMGLQSGAVEMACVALSIPFTKIPPQTWQKEMFTGVGEMTKPSKTGSS